MFPAASPYWAVDLVEGKGVSDPSRRSEVLGMDLEGMLRSLARVRIRIQEGTILRMEGGFVGNNRRLLSRPEGPVLTSTAETKKILAFAFKLLSWWCA